MFKNKLFSKITALYLAIALSLSLFVWSPQTLDASTSPQREFKVVIDAGHGGIDKGTYGKTSKVSESQINLEIALELKRQLENAGISVVLTRDGDYGLYGDCSPGFKRRDMQRRKDIIDQACPNLVISIHCNYSSSSKSSGMETYYNDKNETGKFLATAIQSFVCEIPTVKKCRLDTVSLFMTREIPFPSVIVECGFLSNVEDEKALIDKNYQSTLCEKLKNAVIKTLATSVSTLAV